MALARDLGLAWRTGQRLIRSRLAQNRLATEFTRRAPLKPGTFQIAVYFADGPVNFYQLRQWYKPLLGLNRRWPVVILSRSPSGAEQLLSEAPFPVAYVRRVVDLEKLLVEQPLKIVFYVNQNMRNFQMMRYSRRWHVFINHGESDKMYMTTNQFKAYDYSLIAGDAARERLGRVLWDYDFDKRALHIGRPQADHYSGTLPYTPDDRTVVLYAPTWEGDRPSAHYGSVASHGVQLVRGLLETGRHRVIYRPHPRSGVVDPAYGAANRTITQLIAAANAADPGAQHIHDTGPELGWQLAAADLAVVDISAMVYDRLASGKPLMVTRPVDARAEIDEGGYLSAAEWLDASEARDVAGRADELTTSPEARERLAGWVRHYFGDVTPGATTARFEAAVEHLMAEWERNAELHAGDGPSHDELDFEEDGSDD